MTMTYVQERKKKGAQGPHITATGPTKEKGQTETDSEKRPRYTELARLYMSHAMCTQ